MAYADQARRSLPHATMVIVATAVATIIVAATLAAGPLTMPRSAALAPADPPSLAVLKAEREWEALRHQLSGYVDPMVEAGREWQRQREQIRPD